MKKIVILTVMAFTFWMGSVQAQEGTAYKNAVGVRLGFPTGATFKHFLDNNSALEAIVGMGWGWNAGLGNTLDIAVLYEYHGDLPIELPGRFRWFGGAGPNLLIHTRTNYNYYNQTFNNFTSNSLSVGGDLIMGIDYKFDGLPINVSVDWKPSFMFYNTAGAGFNFGWQGFAVSGRFTF